MSDLAKRLRDVAEPNALIVRSRAADRLELLEALHLCWVDADPDDRTPPHYRPCPPELCEARQLHNLIVEVVQELKERRTCLTGARDDFGAIEHAAVEDGGIWIRAVAQRRRELVDAAISETDKALVALGSFDLCV